MLATAKIISTTNFRTLDQRFKSQLALNRSSMLCNAETIGAITRPRRSARLSSTSGTVSSKLVSTIHNAKAISVAISNPKKRQHDATAAEGFVAPFTPKGKKTKVGNSQQPTPSSTPSLTTKVHSTVYSSSNTGDVAPDKVLQNGVSSTLSMDATQSFPTTPLLVLNPAVKDYITPPADPSSKVNLTKEGVLGKALAHIIAVDPRLGSFVQQHTCDVFTPHGMAEEIDPFTSLASGIIAQQVSTAAARSIKAKFVSLFTPPTTFPSPSQVASMPLPTLRLAGLSQRKAEYIQGLAQKFASGELVTQKLLSASYEEVLADLIKVRGLGQWSVEMFAVFGLKKLDVFSTGDLGVQRGMAVLAGRDVKALKAKKGGKWKYMAEKDMLDMAEKFRPYRSVFMWYTWRLADIDPSVLCNLPPDDGTNKT